MDAFPSWEICIPKPPLQSITHIKWIDSAGVQQTIDPSLYIVDAKSEPGRVTPSYMGLWPNPRYVANAVEIRFVAGYGSDTAVPDDIKQAMLLLIGTYYEHREEIADFQTFALPRGVNALLAHHEIYKF